MVRYWIILSIAFLAAFCSKNNTRKDDVPLARVGDRYLYTSQFHGIVENGTSSQDSIEIVKNYIETWIKKQLLLQKAELNLTADEKDVIKQLEDYRTSLLLFLYEQNMLNQKLDTIVKEQDIKDYYESYTSNFTLNKEIVKAVFIKVPVSAPNLDKLKTWYRSEADEDVKQLENYCFQYAKKYDFFNDDWVGIDRILYELPKKIDNIEDFLKKNPFIESTDSTFNYMANIKEYRLKGETAPYSFVREDIKNIILNKRKMKFVKDLENFIYVDAMKNSKFTIYK